MCGINIITTIGISVSSTDDGDTSSKPHNLIGQKDVKPEHILSKTDAILPILGSRPERNQILAGMAISQK